MTTGTNGMNETTDTTRLERGYRRILACYPREFRRESEQEVLTVLLDTAREGQRRVDLAEAVDLLRGALRMRLRPTARPPRTVYIAIRLMLLGALLELGATAAVAMSLGSAKAALIAQDPQVWRAAYALVIAKACLGAVMTVAWLWLAWANGRGRQWARGAFGGLFLLLSVGLLSDFALGAETYALPGVIALGVLWINAVIVVALLLNASSVSFYGPQAVRSPDRV